MQVTEITVCRSCGSDKLKTVLDLGNLFISDFINPGDEEQRAPLELVCCTDCSLVQLRHTVDRDFLYKGDYGYRSGMNESMVAALKNVVEDALRHVDLKRGDAVLDIGSNDGTLLSCYPEGVKRHGWEPNLHLALESLKDPGDQVTCSYFPSMEWNPPKNKYKIITSIAQFYNVDDVNAYVAEIKRILHREGVWIVQMQDLGGMLDCNGFDNITWEHLTYWCQEAFMRLLDRHNLHVHEVSHNETNGGSIRYFVRHGRREGVSIDEPWIGEALERLAERAEQSEAETLHLLESLKAAGKTVWGYAASTKGNTTLQYFGIGPELLTAIADRNPDKWGKMTVGSHIPIVSEEDMRRAKPDYLLILAWQFSDFFQERERAFLEAGGKFIVPMPELRIVEAEKCQSVPIAGVHSGSV